MVTLHQDTERIRQFVSQGDERAFAELVASHAGLVYHTALRRTRDPHLAEDVTQTVFAILARRASNLQSDGSLAGWLHRTTCLQAANLTRGVARHQARMKAYSKHLEANSQDAHEESQLVSHLDEALSKLAERDRRALFLRFYEDLTLRDVGKVLGKSEDATRKQVQRALERLSEILARRGSMASTLSLTGILSQQMASTAPASLTLHLATKALTNAPAVSHTTILTNLLLTMSTSKAAIIALVLACLPLSWQQWSISKEQGALDSLRTASAKVESATHARSQSVLSQATRGARAPDSLAKIDLKALAEAVRQAKEDGDFQLMATNHQTLNALAKEGAPRLVGLINEAFSLTNLSDESRRTLVDQLFQRLIPISPNIAAKLTWETLPKNFDDFRQLRSLGQALNAWAASAPQEALDWYQSTLGREDFQLPSLKGAEDASNTAMAGLMAGLFKTDTALATKVYETLLPKQRVQTLSQLGTDIATSPELLDTFTKLTATLPTSRGKKRAIESLIRASRSQEAAASVIEKTQLDTPSKVSLYGYAAIPVGSFSAHEFEDGLAWARSKASADMAEDVTLETFVRALQHRQDKIPTILKAWDRQFENFTEQEAALERILNHWPLQSSMTSRGLELTSSLKDVEIRRSLGRKLIGRGTIQGNPMALLQDAGFSSEDVREILETPDTKTQQTIQVPAEITFE